MVGSTSPVVLRDRGYALEPDCDTHVKRLRESNNFFGGDNIGNWISDIGGSGHYYHVVFRGTKVVFECQKHSDHSERWLLFFAKEYAADGHDAASKGKEHVNVLTNSVSRAPWLDGMALVIDVISALIDDAMRAETRFRQWWRSMPTWTWYAPRSSKVFERVCFGVLLQHPGKQLARVARYDKRRNHSNDMFSIGAMGDDACRPTTGSVFDSEDNLTFKPGHWNDLAVSIVPSLVDQFRYMAIPRMECADARRDLVVENLTLEGRDIFPRIVELEADKHAEFRYAPRSRTTEGGPFSSHHVGIRSIRAEDATIERTSARHNPASVFKVDDIPVNVDAFMFAVRSSRGRTESAQKFLAAQAHGEGEKRTREMLKEARLHRLSRIFTRSPSATTDGSIHVKDSKALLEIVADKRDSPPWRDAPHRGG
ncbi:hypothetical protein BJ912DRAFT_1065096 [Pholiota molesta]|nr:hypothetical protein BJ912DRAFT_1065096 [Pholiota molesta]